MIQIYKPNSKNTGCAASFSCGHTGKNQELTVFINVIQQHSWDDKNKVGSFSENKDNKEKTANVKLNSFEVGEVVRAIRTYTDWSAFHSFGEDKTQIAFKTWQNKKDEKFFGLSVSRNGIKFSVPITLGEAETIMIFLMGVQLSKFQKFYAKKENSSKY